jgi:5-methylthioadenosine/S-adenosylhomocysteine deaminase
MIIRNGTVLTPAGPVRGDVHVESDRILSIGASGGDGEILDASGCVVSPGLVQAHVHVCQTLLRGGADDLPLLDWLRQRVWPYEAALDERAMRAGARLAAAELLLGGTTAILDMGTVHEEDALADELAKCGLRAVIGKAMMDAGDGVPARLRESTRASLDESDRLRKSWEGAANGRIGWAYAPRFALSCSEELLREVGARVADGARLHTHASEQLAEVELVRRERGDDNIDYLSKLGLGGDRAVLAHCVHATAGERRRLASEGTHVAHCPSSNLKLGSGIAPIPEMLAEGIQVALGADGAPCNNNLDALQEMRLCALLHKPRVGPAGMTAKTALDLATLGGARALGLGDQIGTLAPGKKADLIVVDLQTPHAAPASDPISALVYAARAGDVRHVVVDGRLLVRDGRLTELSGLDRTECVARAREESQRVLAQI